MTRTDIINEVAKLIDAKSYLEIGAGNRAINFEGVDVPAFKTGVDPQAQDRQDMRKATSDEYFAGDDPIAPYDIIFIDGDHRREQVARDVQNAFKALAPGGVVIMHDCLPISPSQALPEKPNNSAPWCGEAWRTYARYRGLKSYHAVCIDTDHGVGVLRKVRKGEKAVVRRINKAPWDMGRADRTKAFGLIAKDDAREALEGWL